jgi:hypothetical protein
MKALLFPLFVALVGIGGFWLAGRKESLAQSCPHVQHCLDLEPGFHNSVVYMTCLRRIAAPLLWNPAQKWDQCAAAAAIAMVRKQYWAVKIANAKVSFEGFFRIFFFFFSFKGCSEFSRQWTFLHCHADW